MTPEERAALVEAAGETIAKGSQSFAAASRLFDPPTRARAWLLYAWCRAADDMTDGQELGHKGTDAPAAQGELERLTAAALDSDAALPVPFAALREVARETRMPRRFIADHLAGFALDAEGWRPQSEDHLLRYCYHVAGVVGCMMAVVMGVDPREEDTLDRACDLGLAFQLANIARDVAEDAAGDRCYLPLEWLVEMDIPPGQHMHPAYRKRLAVMAKWLAEYVDLYEASARIGATRLPFRSRWAVLAASNIYGAIAEKVRERGEHAWDHRVTTSGAEKTGFVTAALGRAMWAGKHPEEALLRHGLWTRPRG